MAKNPRNAKPGSKKPEKASCPTCRAEITLTESGHVPDHVTRDAGTMCPAAGVKPD